MTNLYSFIQGSLEWPFSKLFFSDVSLWNQHKSIACNIFSCRKWWKHLLDEKFTTSIFLIDGFSSPFRLDQNRKGGGTVYIYIYIYEKWYSEQVFNKTQLSKDYLLKLALEKANGYFLERITHPHKTINIILTVLTKL